MQNSDSIKYRHEYKYLAPESLLMILQSRVQSVLSLDSHTGKSGFYSIRSVYFDDMYNTCYRENEDGTDPREKFRIRIYNGSKNRISLELKQKVRGKCRKLSVPMSYEKCKLLLEGKNPGFTNEDPFLYKKLYAQMQLRNLHPVTIVCYERVPFVYKDGNVRITFDRNIRSSCDFSKFFDSDLPCRPVLGIEKNLLEVKFDELLPDFIYDILQTGVLQQTSFSKYFLCRRYNMDGMINYKKHI